MSWERHLQRVVHRLPLPLVSALGAGLARLKVRVLSPGIAAKARRNVRRLHPDMPPAGVERIVWGFVANAGRMMAEVATFRSATPTHRMEFVGLEEARAQVGRVPTVALCLHLGNWEVLAAAMQSLGIPISSISEILPDEAKREIAGEARQGFDVNVLTPDRTGLRRALAVLKGNGVVAIFPDERRGGTMMAPLFGRPPHLSGNLAMAARIARRVGAQIVVVHCERVGGANFRLHFGRPLRLGPGGGDPLDDVRLLNGLIEPTILRHLDQWYYLDDDIGPIDGAPVTAGPSGS